MDKPSEIWKSLVKDAGSESAARTAATKLYIDKYTKGAKAGEVEFKGEFIAGAIYCFQYVDDKTLNSRPVFLSMGGYAKDGNLYEVGLDLQAAPPQFRGIILDRFVQFYNSDLEKNKKQAAGKQQLYPLRFGWPEAKKSLGMTGWQTLSIGYDRKKVRQVAVVDYSDWPQLIGMQTGGIKDLSKTYSDYLKKAQAKIDKNPKWFQQ